MASTTKALQLAKQLLKPNQAIVSNILARNIHVCKSFLLFFCFYIIFIVVNIILNVNRKTRVCSYRRSLRPQLNRHFRQLQNSSIRLR